MIYWREDKQAWVESSGRLIHDAMRWAILNNERDGAHVWLEGGKSRFQEEARRTAEQIAETIQPAEEKLFCRYCGGDVKDGVCAVCGRDDVDSADTAWVGEEQLAVARAALNRIFLGRPVSPIVAARMALDDMDKLAALAATASDREVGDQGAFADAHTHRATDDQWAELERLAKAATPGPWAWDEEMTLFYNDPDGASCGGEPTGLAEVFRDGDEDFSVVDRARLSDAAFIAAANPVTVLELISKARETDTDVLDWLTERRNVEISYSYGDEDEDGCWKAHRVTGGRNDREWEMIGTGDTPAAALSSARTKDVS